MAGISIHIVNTRLSSSAFRLVCEETLAYVEEISPVRTGYFQANWELDFTPTDAYLYNTTPYGEYLNAGSSKQAPSGLSGPAISFLRSRVAEMDGSA